MRSDSVRRVEENRAAIVAAKTTSSFGPATANSFRKMVGLKEVVWEEMMQKRL
jgi:hypothetical protein